MLVLGVARNSTIDVFERRVGITESNAGNVDGSSFTDSLLIVGRIGDNQETRFTELLGDLVGESTGGVTTRNSLATSVLAELKNSSLRVVTSTNNNNILRVLNGSNDTGSEDELFPGLAEVDDMDTFLVSAENIVVHHAVNVLGTHVDLGSKHLANIIFTTKM